MCTTKVRVPRRRIPGSATFERTSLRRPGEDSSVQCPRTSPGLPSTRGCGHNPNKPLSTAASSLLQSLRFPKLPRPFVTSILAGVHHLLGFLGIKVGDVAAESQRLQLNLGIDVEIDLRPTTIGIVLPTTATPWP